MKKIIVTTTINPKTEAINKFQNMKDWELIVVSDKKTPDDYKLSRGLVITPKMQEEYDKKLSDAIGWNCIQRRNIGYLWAYDMGADIIATVDDDNIPMESWGNDIMVGADVEVNYFESDAVVFDPISVTNYPHLWHRGFPLQLVASRSNPPASKKTIHVDVQADFWNGDPDVDAVCRMTHAPDCTFSHEPFPFSSKAPSPFNSQNTFIHRSVLKDYFLYPGIGRMDDIWAGYYLQSKGHSIVYNQATVFQQRNVHDLTKDMKAEYIGYENNVELLTALADNPSRINEFLPNQAIRSFDLYANHFR